jgi:hypothetical protein
MTPHRSREQSMLAAVENELIECGDYAVTAAWTVKDSEGHLLPHLVAGSRLEVGRKIVPTRYDAFRLEVSSSYRENFDRDLKNVLEREHWQIVPLKRRTPTRRRIGAQLELKLD